MCLAQVFSTQFENQTQFGLVLEVCYPLMHFRSGTISKMAVSKTKKYGFIRTRNMRIFLTHIETERKTSEHFGEFMHVLGKNLKRTFLSHFHVQKNEESKSAPWPLDALHLNARKNF